MGLPRGIMTNQSRCGLGLPRMVHTQHSGFLGNNEAADKAFKRAESFLAADLGFAAGASRCSFMVDLQPGAVHRVTMVADVREF